MHPEEGVLKDFRRSLLVLLSIIPFASAALGFGLLRLGFLPLDRLRSKAGDIGPETLKSRIDPSPFPMEIDPLVRTVNQALDKLESGFTRLSELNSDLAHEMRTPVHALRLECESLLSRGDLPEQTLDSLESMMETLGHMGAVIEQMLVLARFEDPSTSIIPVWLKADALLREAVAPFEPLAEEKGIAIELASSPGLALRGDATLLKRALHNLLGNAVRHAPAGSRIRLSALREGDAAVFAVSDQGEGIPASVLGQLGRRFVRQDASRSRQRIRLNSGPGFRPRATRSSPVQRCPSSGGAARTPEIRNQFAQNRSSIRAAGLVSGVPRGSRSVQVSPSTCDKA